jgi:hypothetical protein
VPRYERSKKGSHLDTVHYEIDMLEYARVKVTERDLPPPEINMRLECFLLHYRNLIEFFSGRKHRDGDISVKKPEVWCSRGLTPEEKAAMTGPAGKAQDEYWVDISQFLQHCTERRFRDQKDWVPQEMWNRLKPAIDFFQKVFLRTDSHNRGFLLGPQSASTETYVVRSTPIGGEE